MYTYKDILLQNLSPMTQSTKGLQYIKYIIWGDEEMLLKEMI